MAKKILTGIIIIIVLLDNFATYKSLAIELTSADLTKIGQADYHLKYYNETRGSSSYVICSVVGYTKDGKFYPAYCVNHDLPGAETNPYTVSVSEIMNNDAVWRVLTDAYPYRTLEQMGLNNEFDAYAVTKMAIYCVLGQSKLEYFSYDENDPIGRTMYNDLQILVDEGLNGTATRKEGTLQISKKGELTKYGDYYFQDFDVKSTISQSQYKINNLNRISRRDKNCKYPK